MHLDLRPLAILVAVLSSVTAQAGEGTRPRAARPPCPQDAPEGVRLPDRPDCAARVLPSTREARVLPSTREARVLPSTREADGFRDVGGVRLRIGGRVSAEYGAAR